MILALEGFRGESVRAWEKFTYLSQSDVYIVSTILPNELWSWSSLSRWSSSGTRVELIFVAAPEKMSTIVVTLADILFVYPRFCIKADHVIYADLMSVPKHHWNIYLEIILGITATCSTLLHVKQFAFFWKSTYIWSDFHYVYGHYFFVSSAYLFNL